MKLLQLMERTRAVGVGLLVLGLVIPVFLFFAADKAVESAARGQFEFDINRAQIQIENRISDYEDIVRGLHALFQTTNSVSRVEFRRYIDDLNLRRKFPGVQNFNFAEYVPAKNKDVFEKKVRSDASVDPAGYPNFRIRPLGERDAYYVITYIEPFDTHGKWLGNDIAARPAVAKALALSRDTGSLVASGKIIQVDDPEQRVALAVRMPVYSVGMPLGTVEERRAAYIGSVGAGFDVRRLMEGALDDDTLRKLRFKLYDMGKQGEQIADESQLLFESARLSPDQIAQKDEFFTAAKSVEVGGRIWQIRFSASKASMMTGFSREIPITVLFGSLLLSILLSSFIHNLMTSRRRALQIASNMTKDLRESEALLASSQQMAHLGNWALDLDSGAMTWSTEACRIFGRDPDERSPDFADFIAYLHDQDRERISAGIRDLPANGGEYCDEYRIVAGKSKLQWIEMIASVADDKKASSIRATVMDVTLRKRLEIQTYIEYQIARLVATSDDVELVLPQILEVLCRGFDWPVGIYRSLPEVGAKPQYAYHWHADVPGLASFVEAQKQNETIAYKALADRAMTSREPVIAHVGDTHEAETKDRKFAPTIAIAFPVSSGDRTFGVIQCFAHDLGTSVEDLPAFLQVINNHTGQFLQRKSAEAALTYVAAHDSLTDLPNRNMFHQALEHALLRNGRYAKGLAVMFIDLDRFKLINDSKGHSAGDQILRECARRLKNCLRESDIIARIGGDEFAVIIEEFQQPGDLSAVAGKIIDAFKLPYWLDDEEFLISASIGISLSPNDGKDVGTLLRNADAAMYRAKADGSGFQFYSMEMNEHNKARFEMELALRHAIENGEFLLHYQPKVDLHSGRVVGVEALVRWKHPRMGLVSPMTFIPLAEETGLIIQIGEWVLNEACKQTKQWRDAGLGDMRVAVNLSARQFKDQALLQNISDILIKTGLPASALELELTESMVMQNAEQATKVLASIKALGIYLSIDDFGTGYSSLAYLRKFSVDCIKIDRAFIKDIPAEVDDMAISKSIISLGHSLRLKVVAEGVETAPQLDFLREQECDEIQGYFFSKPLPAAEILDFVQRFQLQSTTANTVS